MNDSETSSQLPVAPVETFPWPPREGDSAVFAFVTTWKESVLHPTSFFRRMPREDDYGAVVLYYLIIGVAAAGIHLFWSSVLNVSGLREAIFAALGMGDRIPRTSGLTDFLFSPIIVLCALYIGAGLTHLFLKIVGGARYGFDTTTRVVAFAYGPALFAVVPFLGGLVGLVWIVVLTVIGLREAHETTTGKSLAAILLPYAVLFGLIILLALIGLVLALVVPKV